jgi:hypothetical protein
MVLQKAVPELKHQEVLKRKISHFINSFSHNKILQLIMIMILQLIMLFHM